MPRRLLTRNTIVGWRRYGVLLALLVALPSFGGCGEDGAASDSGSDPESTTAPPAEDPEPDLDAALARFDELIAATPAAIANDVSQLALTTVTPDDVALVATRICESGFEPRVALDWLRDARATVSSMMIGPANRLLQLAATKCSRPPSPAESQAYHSTVVAELLGSIELPATRPLPTDLERLVCNALDTQGGQASLQTVLEELFEFGSRGRYHAEIFLPFVLEVAGSTCTQWLPTARAAVEAELGS